MTQAYPLQWPAHIPRSKRRKDGAFRQPFSAALDHLVNECLLMSAKNLVISTNLQMRQDGTGPLKGQREPDDPAVAVYFMRNGETVCIACDKFRLIRANVRAVGKTIEAIRGIERWGSTEMMDQAFQGFTALPRPDAITTPPPRRNRLWHEVLGVAPNAPHAVIQAAYKALAKEAAQSDPGSLAEINVARDEGMSL